ncbi:hypothetical protein EVAR_47379_1 [Eumeta japonica]|uniref:Uncharacterized protein n=1 Tax=Eumeta variegata TaxID=151549 RepID=A0A4C1WWK9_EUMVA|nr:hypothetical protein EVAR_47379_1 [Eumeta japonica]
MKGGTASRASAELCGRCAVLKARRAADARAITSRRVGDGRACTNNSDDRSEFKYNPFPNKDPLEDDYKEQTQITGPPGGPRAYRLRARPTNVNTHSRPTAALRGGRRGQH